MTKVSRQDMIDYINDKIADKELNFWCLVQSRVETALWDSWDIYQVLGIWTDRYWTRDQKANSISVWNIWWRHCDTYMESYCDPESISYWVDFKYDEENFYYCFDIIWHPVLIWTMLRRRKLIYPSTGIPYEKWVIVIVSHRSKVDKPIEDQSDECVEYIYNLLKKWEIKNNTHVDAE